MTNFILVPFVVVGALLAGCEATEAGRDAPVDVALDATPDGAAPAPRIDFEETDFNAGHVAYDTPVTHAYRFRNAGDATLVLTLPLPPVEALEGC